MSEKHRMGADGILNDGVSYYPADEHDLQSYRDAQQALSRLLVLPSFLKATLAIKNVSLKSRRACGFLVIRKMDKENK